MKKWENSILLRYAIRLFPWSDKTLEQAALDMITGVTIGTVQTSAGKETVKTHCLYGPSAGYLQGEVVSVEGQNQREGIVEVAFSPEVCQVEEIGFAGLFSVAAGDGLGAAYQMEKVRLLDWILPNEVSQHFPGPKFGVAGIRELLGQEVGGKPLVALLLKPNTGQPSEHYARFAKEAALGGVNYIKEDELQLNHPACPLLDRVRKIRMALDEAQEQTGEKVLYAPNVTAGSQAQIIENAQRVVELGADAVMINVMQAGLDSLRLLRLAEIGAPIHIHRAGHDNYSRGDVGVDLLVLTKAYRLGGADLIHTGPVFGNLFDPYDIRKNVAALQEPITVTRKGKPFQMPTSLSILSRSAGSAVQDSLDFLAQAQEVTHPTDVMFLVDRDVYNNADGKTGSILEATKKFVETVKHSEINTGRNDEEILKSQGWE